MHDDEDYLPDERKKRKAERKIESKKDRSKFKKTDFHKRERLSKEQATYKLSKKNLQEGRVLSIMPEGILVESEGAQFLCILSGVLKKEVGKAKNLVAVGDFVLFEPEKKAIAAVKERYSVLSRKEHLRQRQEQLIAANIDQVLITVSVVSPPLKPSLIDRYIIATLKGGMAPLIVVNKIDLLKPEDYPFFEEFLRVYESLSIPIIPVSASTSEGIEKLQKWMKNKASVFSGQSGVGKSSLINAVTGLDLPTGELAKKTQKGAHTTSRTHLIPLSCGGWCIDTPGIRSFGLWDLKKEDLNLYFPEIFEVARECKFPDCTHSHEPNCAVREALAEGKISRLRHESYSKLLEEVE